MNPQIAVQKSVPWVKKRLGDSPDETAFFRWGLTARLRRHGFVGIEVQPFDFLHPAIPGMLVRLVEKVCASLEYVPLLREIAGSLYVWAQKPV